MESRKLPSRVRRKNIKPVPDYDKLFRDEKDFVEFVKLNTEKHTDFVELYYSFWWCYATFDHAKTTCDNLRESYTEQDNPQKSLETTVFWTGLVNNKDMRWRQYFKSRKETVEDAYLCSEYFSHVIEELDKESENPTNYADYEKQLHNILQFLQEEMSTPNMSTDIKRTLDVLDRIRRMFFFENDLSNHLSLLNNAEKTLGRKPPWSGRWSVDGLSDREVNTEHIGKYGSLNTFQFNPDGGDESRSTDETVFEDDNGIENETVLEDDGGFLIDPKYVVYNIVGDVEDETKEDIKTSAIFKRLAGEGGPVDELVFLNRGGKSKKRSYEDHEKVLEAYDVGCYRDSDIVNDIEHKKGSKRTQIQKLYAQKIFEAEKEVVTGCPKWVYVYNYVLTAVVTHAIKSVAILCDVIDLEHTDYSTNIQNLIDLQSTLVSALNILCALSQYNNLVRLSLQPADISVNIAIMPMSKEDMSSVENLRFNLEKQLEDSRLRKTVYASVHDRIAEYLTRHSKSNIPSGSLSDQRTPESSRACSVLTKNNWTSLGKSNQVARVARNAGGVNCREAAAYFRALLDGERWKIHLLRMTALLIELQMLDSTTGVARTKDLCFGAYHTSRMLMIDTLSPPVDTPCLHLWPPEKTHPDQYYMDLSNVYIPNIDLHNFLEDFLPHLQNLSTARCRLRVRVEHVGSTRAGSESTNVHVEGSIGDEKANFKFTDYDTYRSAIDGREAITVHNAASTFFRTYFDILYKEVVRDSSQDDQTKLMLTLAMCVVLKQYIYGLYCAQVPTDVACSKSDCGDSIDIGKLTCMTNQDIGIAGYSFTTCAVCSKTSYHAWNPEMPMSHEDCAFKEGATIVYACKAEYDTENAKLKFADRLSHWMVCKPCKDKDERVSICLVEDCGVLKENITLALNLKVTQHYGQRLPSGYKSFEVSVG
eukprot:gene24277-29489_t